MAQIVQASNFNPAALQVDDLYIVQVPPPPYLQGTATDVVGMVGTASWGPVNQAVLLGNPAQLAATYGGITAAALTDVRDLSTDCIIAFNQSQNAGGSPQVWAVRVTDGTDAKATVALKDTGATTGITLTAVYSGTLGNSIQVVIGPGSKTNTYSVTLVPFSGPGAESYPNIVGGAAGVFWSNLLSAINNGISGLRGPSQLVTASGASGTAVAPAAGTFSFTGGLDGRSAVTTATQVGSDTAVPKTGMYALRSVNPPIGVGYLVGNTDSTAYSTFQTLCDSEGFVGLCGFPTGTSTAAAITAKQASGVDDPNMVFVTNWIYFFDAVNNVVRLLPPFAAVAGRIASLAPQNSPANKQIYGIMGTERINSILPPVPYSNAEIGQLEAAGITFICNPCPGGSYYGLRHGQNSSSNPVTAVIEYARMTNFLSKTFANFMGKFVNQLQSVASNDPLRAAVRTTLNQYLDTLVSGAQIDSYQVTCDLTNNTAATIAAHYLYVYVKVRYLSSVKFFVLNLQGGTTVVTVGNSLADILQP